MGQDFRAILRNGIDERFRKSLPELLNTDLEKVHESFTQARLDINSSDEWEWRWNPDFDPPFDEWLASGTVELWRPGSLSFEIAKGTATLGCWVRWREFVNEKKVQQAMREIVFHFAKLLNSELAIYVPDSSSQLGERALTMGTERARLEEIIEYLAHQRSAAKSIDDICKPSVTLIDGKYYETLECEGYFIDHFRGV